MCVHCHFNTPSPCNLPNTLSFLLLCFYRNLRNFHNFIFSAGPYRSYVNLKKNKNLYVHQIKTSLGWLWVSIKHAPVFFFSNLNFRIEIPLTMLKGGYFAMLITSLLFANIFLPCYRNSVKNVEVRNEIKRQSWYFLPWQGWGSTSFISDAYWEQSRCSLNLDEKTH